MMPEHIVKSFDEELNELNNTIVQMGGLAEAQIAESVQALVKRDAEAAARVIAEDKRIDALERDVDSMTVRLLALRQPMAEDLRAIVVALKISSDLERIGDYAKNIAKRISTLTQTPPQESVHTLRRMAAIVQSMIKTVLDAYIERDLDRANDVIQRDEEVDTLHTSLFRELLTYMMEDASNITPCTHLLFVAKNIERSGDHATNIAENVQFLVSGTSLTDDRPKGDESSTVVVEPRTAEAKGTI
jgi:phosphate transport system protein